MCFRQTRYLAKAVCHQVKIKFKDLMMIEIMEEINRSQIVLSGESMNLEIRVEYFLFQIWGTIIHLLLFQRILLIPQQ